MTAPLPALHSAADVAAAVGESEYFVKQKCRLREWPHRRLARGRVAFTDDDYAQVLELLAAPVSAPTSQRLSFAPRSRRTA